MRGCAPVSQVTSRRDLRRVQDRRPQASCYQSLRSGLKRRRCRSWCSRGRSVRIVLPCQVGIPRRSPVRPQSTPEVDHSRQPESGFPSGVRACHAVPRLPQSVLARDGHPLASARVAAYRTVPRDAVDISREMGVHRHENPATTRSTADGLKQWKEFRMSSSRPSRSSGTNAGIVLSKRPIQYRTGLVPSMRACRSPNGIK